MHPLPAPPDDLGPSPFRGETAIPQLISDSSSYTAPTTTRGQAEAQLAADDLGDSATQQKGTLGDTLNCPR
jgi:hypothetical protein